MVEMFTATEILPQQEHERARQAVDEFVARFAESYRLLAYHAALPLVLTPELLNYLRNQFLRGQVPWVAEVDLLLSELCSPAGYELYTMDSAVRAYLLSEMRKHPKLGPERMEQVARLLIHYVRHLAHTDPSLGKHELQAQQWAAMVYLDDKRETAVREIAEAFRNSVVPASVDARIAHSLVNQAEMARLARLTQDLAPGLEKHYELVEYALYVSRLLADPRGIEAQRLYESGQLQRRTRVAGAELPTLETLVPYDVENHKQQGVARRAARQWALLVGVNRYADPAFPSLKYCANDVVVLAQTLISLGYTVVVLHDDVEDERLLPTRSNVEAELASLCKRADRDDLLWVHFSCHGRHVGGQSFLVTKEIRATTLVDRAISLTELERQMRLSNAGQLFVTLDAGGIGLDVKLSTADHGAVSASWLKQEVARIRPKGRRPITIAIDGPAASGKSTIGKLLAERLRYVYLDTGAMYRAVAWAALARGVDIEDESAVTALVERLKIDVIQPTVDDGRQYTVQVDGQDVTWEIQQPEVSRAVSVSIYPSVRAALTAQQRRIAQNGRIVMVGRDIGTVVLPDADLKIYLDATVDERAARRYREVLGQDKSADYDIVLTSVRRRDEIDSSRHLAPLRPADDAVLIDTTLLSVEQVLQQVLALVDTFRS